MRLLWLPGSFSFGALRTGSRSPRGRGPYGISDSQIVSSGVGESFPPIAGPVGDVNAPLAGVVMDSAPAPMEIVEREQGEDLEAELDGVWDAASQVVRAEPPPAASGAPDRLDECLDELNRVMTGEVAQPVPTTPVHASGSAVAGDQDLDKEELLEAVHDLRRINTELIQANEAAKQRH